jgi:hypothetical protein
MKTLKDIVGLPETPKECMVTWISHHFTLIPIPPTPASEVRCRECGGDKGLTPFLDPSIDASRVWFCTSGCKSRIPEHPLKKIAGQSLKPSGSKEWIKFMEDCQVGDLYEDVSFKGILQPDSALNVLGQFAEKPSGVLTIFGTPGGGKTYAALGTAELAMQTDPRVKFFTAIDLASKWSGRMQNGQHTLGEELKKTRLLIIDDIGQGSVKPSLLDLLFEVLSYRIQWKEKGTILTTNLQPDKLMEILGEAMTDRIRNQKWLKFTGSSRRK